MFTASAKTDNDDTGDDYLLLAQNGWMSACKNRTFDLLYTTHFQGSL